MKIYYVNGKMVIHDPTAEMIPLFSAFDSSYQVKSVRPPENFRPKFQELRGKPITLSKNLFELSAEMLKDALAGEYTGTGDRQYSNLDVLQAQALAAMSECRLCSWDCGVNRFQKKGRCGLGHELCNSKPFNHIAEEPPINTAVVTNFGGCALRCIYCISHEVWEPDFPLTNPLAFWKDFRKIKSNGVPLNSIEFTNSTESIAGVYSILTHAPQDMGLAVVMNCNAHGSKLFYELAEPVTDVWLMDIRYGNDDCAEALSNVGNYMKYARFGLDAVTKQDSKVIIRVLVLPGHVECCHEPTIKLLSEYKDKVWVSILDQYVPEKDAYLDPDLRRIPTLDEINEVKALVRQHGLRNIETDCDDFWK
jgi:putative pyruvate formate lyase activating enzyme